MESLQETVAKLEATYQARRDALARDIAAGRLGAQTPEDVVDPSGRSILLDALTALTEAKTALSR